MGRMIAHRYDILEELGVGGMGTVYRGLDTHTQQTVALKQLKSDLIQADMLERFRREGQALRELNHPNIVKMLDSVEEDGNHYLVMDYVSGGDLRQVIEQKDLPIARILQLAIDVADALTRAHRLDIIHRDLKPANVLIADDGTPRLTDFGVALMAGQERVTGTGAIVGTIDYLPPEAFQHGMLDNRADIWAFGVMLFEMLARKRPFAGDSLSQVIHAIISGAVPDLEALRPDAPLGLVDLVYRMLEKDPQARISSVRHVGATLEDILKGRDTGSAVVSEARFFTPPPDSIVQPKHNLPFQTTTFVGREAEVAELMRLLDHPESRLITILGPGGMGKTRLALEVASHYVVTDGQTPTSATQKSRFPDGVYIVELAPLSDPASIITAVGKATHYQFQEDGRDPQQQILDYLNQKKMLLIMDNYEHLMEGANVVTEFLQGTAHLNIIATSRQKLSQTGETIFNLEGMDFPEWETPEDAQRYAAVKLFMQGAGRARPDFELGAEDLPFVTRISRLVRGMPLGILLAASWLSMLSPHEISDEIQQGMDFLESDMGDLPERQRSIRAVFDYSWNLLDETERDVFARLSIFKGGFTREAAQHVAQATLRTLMSLMNKSLLRRDADSGRYEVHELLRQYGHEHLLASDAKDETFTAHSAYYSEWLANLEAKLKGRGQVAALSAIDLEFENIRLAWTTAIQQHDGARINQMIEALSWYCTFRSRFREGFDLLRQARSEFPATSDHADRVAGRLSTRLLEPVEDPLPIFERALAIARHHDDAWEIAWCTRLIGHRLSHGTIDPPEGNRLLEESLAAFQALDDDYMAAVVVDDLAWGYANSGQHERRAPTAQQCLELRQKIGDEIGIANALRNLGGARLAEGDLAAAEEAWLEGEKMALRLGDKVNLVWCKALLMMVQLLKDYSNADERRLIETEALAAELGMSMLTTLVQIYKSLLAALRGDYETGLRIIRQVYPEDGPSDFLLSYVAAWSYISIGAGLEDYALIERALKHRLEMVQIASPYTPTLLPSVICLIAHEGQPERAAEMSGLLAAMPTPARWADNWPPLVKVKASLQQQLGDAAYTAAFERGKTQDVEVVMQELYRELSEA